MGEELEPMKTYTVRLPARYRERFEREAVRLAVAHGRPFTVAEAVRELLDEALTSHGL